MIKGSDVPPGRNGFRAIPEVPARAGRHVHRGSRGGRGELTNTRVERGGVSLDQEIALGIEPANACVGVEDLIPGFKADVVAGRLGRQFRGADIPVRAADGEREETEKKNRGVAQALYDASPVR